MKLSDPSRESFNRGYAFDTHGIFRHEKRILKMLIRLSKGRIRQHDRAVIDEETLFTCPDEIDSM